MTVFRCLCLTAIVLVLVASIEASPMRERENSKESFLRRILNQLGLKPEPRERRDAALIRDPRQTDCMENSDCYPSSVTAVPITLIECNEGRCICNECFIVDVDNGTCILDPCPDYFYNQTIRQCVDDRPSQLTTFLLSFFLSSTGAANFHIDRNGLAAAQLVIFLVFLISIYSICYVSCCLACAAGEDGAKGAGFLCTICLLVLIIITLFLVIWAWWIADLVIFAKNEREAGNGCTLSPDL